jgi:hypothetical protein
MIQHQLRIRATVNTTAIVESSVCGKIVTSYIQTISENVPVHQSTREKEWPLQVDVRLKEGKALGTEEGKGLVSRRCYKQRKGAEKGLHCI